MQNNKNIIEKIRLVLPHMNEAQKRIYLASEALYMERGGKTLLEKELGVSHNTINSGIKELKSDKGLPLSSELRKKGGGRKPKIDNAVWERIKDFIEPHSRGEPESPLQ